MLVGPLGSGKSTRAAWRVLDYKQRFPWVPRVGNLEMNPQDIAFVPDVLRFLALKFVRDGNKPESQRVPMLIIVDEANTSGLESRGSGFSPGQTTVLQFVRKLKVHCILISQLMCLAEGTLIKTPTGYVPIEQIKIGDSVIDNTFWGERIKRISNITNQTQDKILRIQLESGHEIKATPNHRFPVYVRQQQKRDVLASDLMVGDILKIDRWHLKRIADPLYQFLGLIHAEGSFRAVQGRTIDNQLSIALDKREIELHDFVGKVIHQYRPKAHIGIHTREGTNQYVMVLSKTDDVQFFKGKYEDFLLSGGKSNVQKASFLSGFFEGDGCVETRTWTLSLCQSETNRHKLEVGMNLLRDLGIPFRLYTDWRPVGGLATKYAKQNGYVVNRLKIGAAYAGIFAHKIGFISSVKQNKLEGMSKNLYARISNIEEINEPTKVYDLTIEKGAPYFVANGIRTHNSMTDRRGQWLAHYYTLCKGIYRPGESDPAQFEYKIYDEGYRYQKTEYLRGSFCQQYIFPRFDSWSIPNYDAIAIDLIRSNKLTTQDFEDYNNIVKFYASLSPIGPQEKWFGKKWNAFWDMSERERIPPLKVRRV